MNEVLSKLVADLFAGSKGGEELSPKIHRLRDEIKKVIEREDAIFGKLRGLLGSFREVIPDENQRYHAAIKALSTTSKLSQQEIIKAINGQLEELKIIEKGLMPALPNWRDELKALEARSKEIRAEVAKLRDTIVRLESEEEGIRNSMSSREKNVEFAEKAMRDLFAEIGAEIASVKKKVEEFTAEGAPVQQAPQKIPAKIDVPGGSKGAGEQKIEIQGSPEPMDTKWQKKCPMCGGRMNLHALDKMWICYSCAHEESTTDEGQGASVEEGDRTNAPELAPDSEPASGASSPFAVPLADLSSDEIQGSKKDSSPSKAQPPTKSKPCPACRKKMYWFPTEKAWRCPSCYYERRI